MYIIDNIIVPYILSNKTYLLLYLILSFMVYTIGSLLIPRTITEFINATNKKEVFGVNLLKTIQSGSMMGILYLLGILFTIYTCIDLLKDYFENDILLKISTYTKKEIIRKIFYKYTNNYKEIPESEVSWVIQNTYGTIRNLIRYFMINVIPCFIMFFIISIYFVHYDKMIGTLFIGQYILLNALIYGWHNSLFKSYYDSDTKNITNNNIIGDKIKNLMNIIFDNHIENEINSLIKNEDELLEYMNECYYKHNTISFIINILSYFILFVILYKLLYKDKKVISTLLLMFLLYKGIQDKFLNDTLYQYFSLSKIMKINDFIQDINEDDTCKNIKPFYSIKLNNVSYRYDEKSGYILRNLNIHFKPKEINVLMGKSGSGKTTIMKLIIKMYNPTKGDIYLDETNSKDICQTDIRNNIYYVNQRTILFDETVLYNLQYGNDISKNVILELLNKYDLLDYYKTLEHGLDSTCGVNGSNLSLGMQKIIMVVRGILKPNKPILIFDEPLTSLDKETRVKIVKFIVNETKGKTVIIISHDPEILPYADNIIRL